MSQDLGLSHFRVQCSITLTDLFVCQRDLVINILKIMIIALHTFTLWCLAEKSAITRQEVKAGPTNSLVLQNTYLEEQGSLTFCPTMICDHGIGLASNYPQKKLNLADFSRSFNRGTNTVYIQIEADLLLI